MATKPSGLDSLLECPICLSECEDPRVLPCLHTLCLKCLDQHIGRGQRFLCPSCRHECVVPAGGVTSVPKNFFLNSLKAIIEEQKERGEVSAFPQFSTLQVVQQECSNSGRDDDSCGKATVFCIECAKFYCLDCQSSHRKFEELSNHQLVPVSSPNADYVIKAALSRERTPRCDQHSNLPTDMYCDTCRIPVCMKCCVLKHKEHQYREIEEAGEESKSLLSKLTKTAKKISSRLEEHMQGLDASEKAINTNCDEASRQVHEDAEEIRALVTEKEDSMVQEISQAQTSALTQLKAAYKEAEMNKAAVDSLLSYIQALLVSEDVTNQVVHAPGLQEQLRQQEVAPLQSVTLEVNLEKKVQNLAALNAMFGAVSVQQTTETRNSPQARKSQKGARRITRHSAEKSSTDFEVIKSTFSTIVAFFRTLWFILTTLPSQQDVFNEFKLCSPGSFTEVPLGPPLLNLKLVGAERAVWVSGIVTIGDHVFVTASGRSTLWIHNIRTNTHKQHTLDGVYAKSMTLLNDNTLVIADLDRRIHLIKTDHQMNITHHTVEHIPFAGGITVNSASGKLIITNNTDKCIATCDTQGGIHVERRVEVKADIGQMACAVSTCDGYVVLGLLQPIIHWLSRDGELIRTYCEKTVGLSRFHGVVDSQGRVIVANEYHNHLHLIDANDNLSHYLLTQKDGMLKPTCVYLDEVNARLFVGWKDETGTFIVSTYRWPFVSSPTVLTQHKLCVELIKYQ